jgi:hypothetical protein
LAAQLTATSTFGALIGDIVGNVALIAGGQRSIGGIYPHVTMEEVHEDRLQITQHPIDTGTPVTDHSFMQPYTVEIRCGWSDSTAATQGFVQTVYQELLALQASRQPFAVRTGKRAYTSMLMASLGVKTDPDSEYALMVTIIAQQIIIVGSSATSSSSPTSGSAAIDSGAAAAADPGSVTPDSTGAVTWPNDPASSGTPSLSLPGASSGMDWQSLASQLQAAL